MLKHWFLFYVETVGFLVADTQLYNSLCPSVRPSVGEHESKSVKTRISAPAHPSATGGRVSGLVAKVSLPQISAFIQNHCTIFFAKLEAISFEQLPTKPAGDIAQW